MNRGGRLRMSAENGFQFVQLHLDLYSYKGMSSRPVLKVNHLPFIDSRPSANGNPEEREYRGLGYDGDQQVGQPSAIVTGIWGV